MNNQPNFFVFTKIFHDYLMNPKTRENWKWKVFVALGSKNIGKTYSFLQYAINDYKKYQRRFLIIFRLQLQAFKYWDQETSSSNLWSGFTYKSGIIYDEFKRVAGRITSINGSTDGKGKANEHYANFIVDDFIKEQWEDYIPLFTERLNKIISNYARTNLNEACLFLSGNNNDIRSEYLNDLEITYPKNGGYTTRNDLKLVLYNEGVETTHGMFATHLKQYENTCLASVLFKEDTKNYYLKNLSGMDDWMMIRTKDITPNPNEYTLICLEKAFWKISWDEPLQSWVMYRYEQLQPQDIIYAFSPLNLTFHRQIIINHHSINLAFFIIKQIQNQRFRATNLVAVENLMRECLAITSRKEIYGEKEILIQQ